jgi:hypothetical protein
VAVSAIRVAIGDPESAIGPTPLWTAVEIARKI